MSQAVRLPEPSEHSIMDSIIDLLNYEGYMAWRNNVGAKPFEDRFGRKRFVRFGKPGMSDIFAIAPKTGRFVALEVKRPKTRKNVTWWQEDFINQVKLHGGIAAVVCSREEVAELLGIKLLF